MPRYIVTFTREMTYTAVIDAADEWSARYKLDAMDHAAVQECHEIAAGPPDVTKVEQTADGFAMVY